MIWERKYLINSALLCNTILILASMAAEENLFVLVEQSPDHAGTLDRLKSKISGEGDQRASPASSSSKLKCPRVPKKLLLDVKAQAHNVPKRISLGPYHHGNPRLSGGETLKLKLADDFITWCEWSVEEIYSSICIHVRELKDCYEEETAKKFRDDVFTEMMLVDGCALLWYIICVCEGYDHEDYDIRYQDLCLLHQDALLLENQLPYPVLQQLMKLLDLSPESWTVIFKEFFGMIEESSFQEFFGIKQKPFLQRMKDYCCRLFLPLIRNIKGNPEPKPKEESQPKPEEELEPNLEEESQPRPEEESQPRPEEESKARPEEESMPRPQEESRCHHLLDLYRRNFWAMKNFGEKEGTGMMRLRHQSQM